VPKELVKSGKSKGLSGGGKGGTKGTGVVQSVLDLQKQIGNDQTVKTVLGPDVASQFSALASKGGKKSSLFFTTSTYKEIKKMLTEYSVKQASKPGAWRRGHVGQLEGLLESWFSKDKNIEDKSEVGKAKWAAMKWLQPKLKSELANLNGSKAKEEAPSGGESQAPQQWQQGETPGGEQSGPTIGTRGAWQKGTVGGERGGVTIGDKSKQPPPKTEEKTEDEPTNGPTPYSVTELPDPYEDVEEKVDEVVEDKVEEKKVEEKKSNGYEAYSVTEVKDPYEDVDDKGDDKEPSSAKSDTKSSSSSIQQDSDSQKSQKSASDSKSSDTIEDIVDGVAKEVPKWSAFRQRDDSYGNEFTLGSTVLVNLYNDVREARKLVDGDGKFVGYDNPKKRSPKAIPLADDEERAAYALWGWKWSKSTFGKYWKLMVAQWGENPPNLAPPKKSEFDDLFDSDVSDPTDTTNSSIDDRYASESDAPKDGANEEEDEQEEDEHAYGEKKKKPLELLVKAKETEKEREKYKLGLASTITRGPKRETLDTKDMMTNKAGAGYGIFVMSQNGEMYAGSHKVGIFHHSSFLAAGQVAGAGELKVSGGKLQHLTNKSGHYLPRVEHNLQVIEELRAAGIAPSSYAFTDHQPNEKKKEYTSAEMYLAKQNYKGRRAIPNR
jgi:hypothetical protein